MTIVKCDCTLIAPLAGGPPMVAASNGRRLLARNASRRFVSQHAASANTLARAGPLGAQARSGRVTPGGSQGPAILGSLPWLTDVSRPPLPTG